MDPRFTPHNAHLESPTDFLQRDPQLRELKGLKLVHHSHLIARLPREPGVYTVTGGRQVGKTTLLKQWMAELLAAGVAPAQIAFFTGELIDDHHVLVRLLEQHVRSMPEGIARYLIVDEVSYIRDWDRGVKFLADAGLLAGVVLVLSGSDSVLIQDARIRLPGRRGVQHPTDFHLYPLTFREAVELEGVVDLGGLESHPPSRAVMQELVDQFEAYLMHGGYLTAINDVAANGFISAATLATYSDWIRGDVLKRGKQEQYLREVMAGVVERYGSQITWNALARSLSIDHPRTVADYIELLARMDAVFVQPALLEDKLTAAPKKARKVMFTDPFVFHAVRAWLTPSKDPWGAQIQPAIRDPEWCGKLAEACAATHFRRYYPTFYIKAEGEVDIAVVDGRTFVPIEVKWTGQLRPKELKQIRKYENARILTRSLTPGSLHGVPTEPLPLALLRLA